MREEDSYHLVERRYGACERSFAFPTPVESDNVDAEIKDGCSRCA